MSNDLNGRWVFRFCTGAIGSPRSLDRGTGRSAGVGDIEWWRPLRDDGGFDRVRCGVLAPAQLQVGVHPCGQAGLVLVDEHDAVGAAGPVVLGIEQESGEGAAEGGLSAAAQVVPDDSPAQVLWRDRHRGAAPRCRTGVWGRGAEETPLELPTTRTSPMLRGESTGRRARGVERLSAVMVPAALSGVAGGEVCMAVSVP